MSILGEVITAAKLTKEIWDGFKERKLTEKDLEQKLLMWELTFELEKTKIEKENSKLEQEVRNLKDQQIVAAGKSVFNLSEISSAVCNDNYGYIIRYKNSDRGSDCSLEDGEELNKIIKERRHHK